MTQPIAGSIALGDPQRRGNKFVVPVIVDSQAAEAMALRVVFSDGGVRNATIHRAGAARALQPTFEISRGSRNALAYIVSFNDRVSGVVAEIEIDAAAGAHVSVDVDPSVTILSNAAGTREATVAAGTLHVSGTAIGDNVRPDRKE